MTSGHDQYHLNGPSDGDKHKIYKVDLCIMRKREQSNRVGSTFHNLRSSNADLARLVIPERETSFRVDNLELSIPYNGAT